jgi:HAMP domain-containing protein
MAQAHAAIPLAERRCEPVPLDACQRWLSAVALLCVQSGTRAEVQAWMSAMSSVLGDYPAGCFTAATLKQAARAGNGWRPSYAAMAKILDPVAADVSVAPTRLRQIVNAGVASDRDRSRPINRPALEPGPKYTSGTWADCVHDRAISVRDVVLVDTDAERRAAIEEIEHLTAFYAESDIAMDRMIAARDDTTAQETAILNSIKRTEIETLPLIEEVIRLKQVGNSDQAHSVLMGKALPLFIRWLAQINQFIDLQEEFNKAEGGTVRETADGFQVFMLGAFAIALLLSLALGAWTMIAIRPLRASTDIMRRLADGDLLVEIPASSDRHEVGDILRSLERIASTWTRESALSI